MILAADELADVRVRHRESIVKHCLESGIRWSVSTSAINGGDGSHH